jgi:hypothetical protein
MWKIIEAFGIKRESFLLLSPTDEDIFEVYQLIKKRIRDKRDDETIKRLHEYIEKVKNRAQGTKV